MNLQPFCTLHDCSFYVVMSCQHVLIQQIGAACGPAVPFLHFCSTAVVLCLRTGTGMLSHYNRVFVKCFGECAFKSITTFAQS